MEAAAVQQLLDQQRDEVGWGFVFLGANQDAFTTGSSLGFARESSLDFDADTASVAPMMTAVSSYVSSSRAGTRGQFSAEDRRRPRAADPESTRGWCSAEHLGLVEMDVS